MIGASAAEPVREFLLHQVHGWAILPQRRYRRWARKLMCVFVKKFVFVRMPQSEIDIPLAGFFRRGRWPDGVCHLLLNPSK
jgi:hypothetical protein